MPRQDGFASCPLAPPSWRGPQCQAPLFFRDDLPLVGCHTGEPLHAAAGPGDPEVGLQGLA